MSLPSETHAVGFLAAIASCRMILPAKRHEPIQYFLKLFRTSSPRSRNAVAHTKVDTAKTTVLIMRTSYIHPNQSHPTSKSIFAGSNFQCVHINRAPIHFVSKGTCLHLLLYTAIIFCQIQFYKILFLYILFAYIVFIC